VAGIDAMSLPSSVIDRCSTRRTDDQVTKVVLPAPVGPTMAIVWPGSATSERFLDERAVS